MYNIALYENGRFCTNVGGTIDTLQEAIDQMKQISSTLQAQELQDYFGYKFDRAGTTCALVITDRWNYPIFTKEEE